MKHLLKIALGLIGCAGVFLTACNDDDEPAIVGFTVEKTEIAMNAEGGTETVKVVSAGEWVAAASKPWITVSPANGVGTTECVVTVDSSLVNEPREAEVRFLSKKGGESKNLVVTQLGFGKQVYVKEAEVKLDASTNNVDKRYFESLVTTNVPFTIEVEYLSSIEETGLLKDWISFDNPKFSLESARPTSFKLRFNWKINPEWVERVAKIHFRPIGEENAGAVVTPITVTQKASPKITDDRAGDSLAIIAIMERMNATAQVSFSENLSYWPNVVLWERNDELPTDELGNPIKEAIGRVRALSIIQPDTKESIAQEVRFLKYLETFSAYGNVNTMLLNITLGDELCELKHLKNLQVGAYGLIALPERLKDLGKTLEVLDLSGNNFTSVPSILTKENFPHLKSLSLNGNRRWGITSLKEPGAYTLDEIGLHMNLSQSADKAVIEELLRWDTLEELVLSYNYLEGSLPDCASWEPYKPDDELIQATGDTLQYLVKNRIPKVLPKMKHFKINLNFLTGSLPKWLLYHPYFMEWYPEMFIYNQMENGIDAQGNAVKFNNTPSNFEYYFNAFPLYRAKYEINEEDSEGGESKSVFHIKRK